MAPPIALPATMKRGGQRTYTGLWPVDLPKCFPVFPDFTTQTQYQIDLVEEQSLGQIPFVQTVYVDNSQNSVPLTLQTEDDNQNLTVPPGTQGYFTLLARTLRFLASVPSSSGVLAPGSMGIFFLSAPTPTLWWSATAGPQPLWAPSTAVIGSYAVSGTSGTMAAALAANSPIFAFRGTPNAGTGAVNSLLVIRKVTITIGDLAGFTAGFASFALFAARGFTALDTGGSALVLTGNNGKLRTSFANAAATISAAEIATTTALTPGTRVLDTTPLATIATSVTANAGQPVVGPIDLFHSIEGEQPLQLASNEGFVITATVPATGTWDFSVNVDYDYVNGY